jgi:anti-anti-sigma regulatory factor
MDVRHTGSSATTLQAEHGAPGWSHHNPAVRVWYPSPDTVVLALSGTWSDAGVPRVRELLEQRLRAMVRRLIVDLSGLRSLSARARRLLGWAQHRADTGRIVFAVVTGGVPAVEQVLTGGGSSGIVCCPTLDAAMRHMTAAASHASVRPEPN